MELNKYEKGQQLNHYEIKCFTKKFVTIDFKPYRRLTKFEPLYRLLERGENEIKHMYYEEVINELDRISNIQNGFIFQVTIHTWDNLFFRYFFLNGMNYSTQGEITFDDFRIENFG